MSPFTEARISPKTRYFLKGLFQRATDWVEINQRLQAVCGVATFFETSTDAEALAEHLAVSPRSLPTDDRVAYGDFQTNATLATRIVGLVKQRGFSPQVVIEPTCGKGTFLLAALDAFSQQLQRVIGIEIYQPYVWAAKMALLEYFLERPHRKPPQIELLCQDIFSVDLQQINQEISGRRVLVLGNPPWVTNAQLGAMRVANLPHKANFRNLNGLDALTGKSNFDISESIALMLLRAFQHNSGGMALLLKNAVIKNLLFEQPRLQLRIGRVEQYVIDAQKEFGVSVEASLMMCCFDRAPETQCLRTYLEPSGQTSIRYGWEKDKFVADLKRYRQVQAFDGICPFEWRQGLKHDCTAVMELTRVGDGFSSAADAEVRIENDLVFGLLKSSELKGGQVAKAKKYTIVTQRRIGQDTSYIREMYPLTYRYLSTHSERFARRKSSIYRGKPPFSIFGIGNYSFLPYKVAISGLYKMPVFTLVLPENGRPLMLDDTCYFIGFEQFSQAAIAFALLNAPPVADLLEAITFAGAKRRYTKEVLQRIDLGAIAQATPISQIQARCRAAQLENIPSEQDYKAFLDNIRLLMSPTPAQLALF
ncbi:MAG: hypothetical protein RMJ33_13720 [Saprospiraceae bacterium]|nr:hypothetical protein [Saprospiraceae bacterium]MDW8230886.1 hypothetical protein [Saprospiraceae bacterium]